VLLLLALEQGVIVGEGVLGDALLADASVVG
jgi:hypothetical protein